MRDRLSSSVQTIKKKYSFTLKQRRLLACFQTSFSIRITKLYSFEIMLSATKSKRLRSILKNVRLRLDVQENDLI